VWKHNNFKKFYLIFGEFFRRKGNIQKKNIFSKKIHLAKWEKFATKKNGA
jgi:hypothetical protein